MLILMSDVFQISLDQLVKGEDHMNNMTEKVIRDGSETRRARFNMITTLIGGSFLLIGVMLLVIKGMSVEYIDAEEYYMRISFNTNRIFMYVLWAHILCDSRNPNDCDSNQRQKGKENEQKNG